MQPTMSWNHATKGSGEWSKTYHKELRSHSPSTSIRKFPNPMSDRPPPLKLPPLHRYYPSEGAFLQGNTIPAGYHTTNSFGGTRSQTEKQEWSAQPKPSETFGQRTKNEDFVPHHLKHKFRKNPIGESYNQIHIKKIEPSNDGALMTQAKIEKSKRTKIGHRKVLSYLRNRADFIKHTIMKCDSLLSSLRLTKTIKIQLVLNFQLCEFCCLERTVSISKLIEQFIVVYHMNFEGEKVRMGDSGQEKILLKLKEFLTVCATHAFEMSTDSEEVFQHFSRLSQFQRVFCDAEHFHKANPLECVLLNYIFLEYKVEPREESTVQTSPSLRSGRSTEMQSEVGILELSYPRSLAEIVEPTHSEHSGEEDPEEYQQRIQEEAANNLQQRMKELNETIQKSKGEIKLMRAGVNSNGDFEYSSKFLNTINLCLQNKDIIFDMDAGLFNQMAQMDMPEVDSNNLIPVTDSKDTIRPEFFNSLLKLKEFLGKEIRYTGKSLEKDLGLEESAKDMYNYSEDSGVYESSTIQQSDDH